MIYQGEKEALAYFESTEYWSAVNRRATWDPSLNWHTPDDVCSTVIFKIKTDPHTDLPLHDHSEDNCGCYSIPNHIFTARWTPKDEEEWLNRGHIRLRHALHRKHYTWAKALNFEGQMIK